MPTSSVNSSLLIILILEFNKGFLSTPLTYLPLTYSPKNLILIIFSFNSSTSPSIVPLLSSNITLTFIKSALLASLIKFST